MLYSLRRPLPFWLLAAVLAGLTGAVVTGLIGRAEEAAARYGSLRPVVVAVRTVDAGRPLTRNDVEVRQLPAALVPRGALRRAPIGRVATDDIYEGEPVVADRVGPDGLGPVAALLPPGTRGVAVPAVPPSPRLRLGDVVDLLATFDAAAADEGDPTFPVAVDAVVVDVGEEAVTVAVDTTDAPRVAFAVAQGVVTLALSAGPSPG